MSSEQVRLRYLGVSSNAGTREYAFMLPDPADDRRFTILVRDIDFSSHQLSFQEAPDLCYQKLRAVLEGETDVPIASAIWVTEEDLARYRETHQKSKSIRGRWTRPVG